MDGQAAVGHEGLAGHVTGVVGGQEGDRSGDVFGLAEVRGGRFAEKEALEPTLSENITKLQISDNQSLYTTQSKSKSF